MKKNNLFKKGMAGFMAAALCVSSGSMMGLAQEADTEAAETEAVQTDGAEAAGLGVVETVYGQAQGVPGETYQEVTLFKGMPYAAPPVGDLRWRAPEDPEAWDGVRVFDTYADAPCQWENDMASDPWKTDFYYEDLPTFSEDCLYLNIATSSVTGDEKMPVYVWFHGGGLNHGYSYEIECDPEALAAKGVVVVEVGTRLGVFGYMSLPQLDEESEYGASGNYGLMDSIKAVEWVKDNIEAFGGDPENITIGGQSGGTSKTGAFFASDEGAALVDNVIWQSGLNLDISYASQEDIQETSIAWLQACGLTGEESLEELRAMDASVFMGEESEYGQAPQSMTVDGQYIQYENLLDAYADGQFEGVNILVGTNLGEFTETGVGGHTMETADEFYSYYRELLGDLYDEYDFENLVSVTDENALDMARTLETLGINDSVNYFNLAGDMLFGQFYDETNDEGNVYVYMLSHRTPGRDEDYYWAWHSSELWYTFGSLRDVPEQRDWEEWDYELADLMTSYWANFMRNGDPNGEGLAEWLPSNTQQLAYMEFGEADTTGCVTDMDQLQQLAIEFCRTNYEMFGE